MIVHYVYFNYLYINSFIKPPPSDNCASISPTSSNNHILSTLPIEYLCLNLSHPSNPKK